MINKKLKNYIDSSIEVKKSLLRNFKEINHSINYISRSLKNGGKILIAGNGGAAADAQHLVAEFLVRLQPNINRKGISALTLAQDTSTITACSNDYSFDLLFARNLETLGNKKDILLVISTSGNSNNIYKVLKVAKKMKIFRFTTENMFFDAWFVLSAFIGGALLSFASHGADYMMVQRVLATNNIKSARKARKNRSK